jgi:hypothetical protein
MTPELFDAARLRLERTGFDRDAQTKIALFLNAAKTANATFLGAAQLLPVGDLVMQFLQAQQFREIEFTALLSRVTRWSMSPLVYGATAPIVAPLWPHWWSTASGPGATGIAGAAEQVYSGLAFGHALLAHVRLTPVIPRNAEPVDAFVVALQRIEQENGRMLQTQIRLLKEACTELPVARREAIVEEKSQRVEDAFTRFLGWLAEG